MSYTYISSNYSLNTLQIFCKTDANQYFEKYCFLELLSLSMAIFLKKKKCHFGFLYGHGGT